MPHRLYLLPLSRCTLLLQLSITQALQHPYIVQPLFVFRHAHFVYLITEWVPDNLATWMCACKQDRIPHEVSPRRWCSAAPNTEAHTRQRCPLPPRQCCIRRIARQLLQAVQYMHEKGLVHRHLKPQQVRIRRHVRRTALGALACLAMLLLCALFLPRCLSHRPAPRLAAPPSRMLTVLYTACCVCHAPSGCHGGTWRLHQGTPSRIAHQTGSALLMTHNRIECR